MVRLLFTAALVIWGVTVGLLNLKWKLIPVAGGFIFFQTVNWILRRWVSRDPVWVNTCVSFLHSTLTSWAVILIVLKQWLRKSVEMFEEEEMVDGSWEWAYTTVCFCCGYFGYDQWDMLKYKIGFPSVLAHHLVLLICFTVALYRNITINYLILTLICELHSVFLHVRKLRRMGGIKNAASFVIKAEWLLNCLTFIFARLLPHSLILILLVKHASYFTYAIEFALAFFGIVAMNALNIGLAIDLFRAFKKEISPHPH